MKIRLDKFSGIVPRIAPKLLPSENAQVARNCKLYNGYIQPLKAPLSVIATSIASPSTIFLAAPVETSPYGDWCEWADDIDCVRGPNPDDMVQLYWTGEGTPKKSYGTLIWTGAKPYPATDFEMGMPYPATAPTVAATPAVTGDEDPADLETRYYVYTWVNVWGEEGPPSDPAEVELYPETQTVDISALETIPAPNPYNLYKKYIYRTNTGTEGTEFQFVAEVAGATATYNDAIPNDELGEVIPSVEWFEPPADMHSLCVMANGILAGASGKNVCLSEAYLPHAWPPSYRLTCDDTIVAMKSFETNLVVTTESYTYLVTGVDPAAMTMSKLSIEQSCIAKRSMVNCGKWGVVYASPDGLISVSNDGIQNILEPLMSKAEWQAYPPEYLIGAGYDDLYYGFWITSTGAPDQTRGGFIFDPAARCFVQHDQHARALYFDLRNDLLFTVDQGEIFAFDYDDTTPLEWTWKSKKFEMPYPVNFGSAKVDWDVDDGKYVTFNIYADSVLQYTYNLVDTEPFRLPSGYLARIWEIEMIGNTIVRSVEVVETMNDYGSRE